MSSSSLPSWVVLRRCAYAHPRLTIYYKWSDLKSQIDVFLSWLVGTGRRAFLNFYTMAMEYEEDEGAGTTFITRCYSKASYFLPAIATNEVRWVINADKWRIVRFTGTMGNTKIWISTEITYQRVHMLYWWVHTNRVVTYQRPCLASVPLPAALTRVILGFHECIRLDAG